MPDKADLPVVPQSWEEVAQMLAMLRFVDTGLAQEIDERMGAMESTVAFINNRITQLRGNLAEAGIATGDDIFIDLMIEAERLQSQQEEGA
jgi:uncharacterized coiled-coil protein SlyX